jgi:secreted PhoX family phosphatase
MTKPARAVQHEIDADDIGSNDSSNPDFQSVLHARLSRRSMLRGGLASAAGALFGSLGLSACAGGGDGDGPSALPSSRASREKLLGFKAVAKSVADMVTVPAGYTATVLYALGDPLTAATPAYRNDGTDAGFENRAGDHHDGMEYFGLSASGARDPNSSERALLAMNHEALTQHFLHPDGASPNPRPRGESEKEITAHGVSVVEIRRTAGKGFATVQDSAFNRRITPMTPVELAGVARGSALMKTAYSAAGTDARGTINNCGTGITPWGTLLTGEENWAGYFARGADPVATGNKYLDNGRLYVARLDADGSGEWIELSIDNPAIRNFARYSFADQADVAINTRLAADAVGATKMDRPEWCSVHPVTGEVYYTLTNNSNRRLEPTGTQMGLDAANPRAYTDQKVTGGTSLGNVNGHIIRMAETGDNGAALTFAWDVYLFGAQSDADPSRVNLSSLTSDQDFSSPDGLWFSRSTGLCWIQTDDGAYTDVSNCMMLAAMPGAVGDGAARNLGYTRADGTTLTVQTRVGRAATQDTLKRFLVGPVDCEITGAAETPDGRALFVNIQHPGESITAANVADPGKYVSHWPANAGYGAGGAMARPRSATVVITKDDGGVIGS